MKYVLLAAAVAGSGFASNISSAAESTSQEIAAYARAVTAAEREVESARIRLRLYVHEEHARRLRRLDHQIQLAREVLRSYERRVTEYRRFDRFRHSSPLLISLEEARLDALRAKLHLDDLREERSLLTRHHADRYRLQELQLRTAEDALFNLRRRRAAQENAEAAGGR